MKLTETAVNQINKILEAEDDAIAMRVTIVGGYSGYSYKFDLADEINDNDIVLTLDGATVVVDPSSFVLVKEGTLDFTKSLQGSEFSISVPESTQ